MLLSSAIPALFQAGKSFISSKEARDYAKSKKLPKYEIPESIKKNLKAAEFSIAEGMPGAGQAQRQMQRTGAEAAQRVMQSGEGAESLAAIAAINQNMLEQEADQYSAGASWRAARLNDISTARRLMAGEEKAAWEWDKKMPYLAAMETASKFERQANQELYQGLEGLADVATSGLMMGYQDQNLGTNWFGKTAGDAVGAAGAAAGTGMGLTAAGAPSPTYFDPNAVYGTGAAKPYEEYGAYGEELFGGDMPMEMTQPAVNAYFGGEVPMDVQEYYGLGSTMGNALRNIFSRRRGSSRSYTVRRGF